MHFAEKVLTEMPADYEIVIVDDATTDRSPEIADALAQSNACVKVFHHQRNLKLGGTLRTDFSKATKELVFYCNSVLPVALLEIETGGAHHGIYAIRWVQARGGASTLRAAGLNGRSTRQRRRKGGVTLSATRE